MKSHSHFIGSSGMRGFTLIELMVVVAIIAILAAIMFPVFGRAREQAFKTTCLQNQRSLVQAMLIYVGDNRESFPMRQTWVKDIGLTGKVFNCPASSRDGTMDDPDYAYNANLHRVSIGDLGAAHATEVTIDSPGLSKDGTASVYALLGADFRHNDAVIASYADGHVALVKANQKGRTRESAPYALGMFRSKVIRCFEYDDQEELRDDMSTVFNNGDSSLVQFPNALVPLNGKLVNGQWWIDGTTPPAESIAKYYAEPFPTGFGNSVNYHLAASAGLSPVHLTLDFELLGVANMSYFGIDGDNQNDPGSYDTFHWGTNDPPRPSDNTALHTLIRVRMRDGNGLTGTNVVFGSFGNPTIANPTGNHGAGVIPEAHNYDFPASLMGKSYQISSSENDFIGGTLDMILHCSPTYGFARNDQGNYIFSSWARYTANPPRPLRLYSLDAVLVTQDGRSFAFDAFVPAPANEVNSKLIFGARKGFSAGVSWLGVNSVSLSY